MRAHRAIGSMGLLDYIQENIRKQRSGQDTAAHVHTKEVGYVEGSLGFPPPRQLWTEARCRFLSTCEKAASYAMLLQQRPTKTKTTMPTQVLKFLEAAFHLHLHVHKN